MKKIVSMFVAVLLLMSVSVTAFAEDMSSGNGESQVYAHLYSRYTVSIPATIDLRNGDIGEVTITDASVEDGYSVKVFASNLTTDGGITLTHTNGTSTINCILINTEKNTNVTNDVPLVSFTSENIEQGVTTKYFSLEPESFGKAGDYSGTLQYSFSCSPQD